MSRKPTPSKNQINYGYLLLALVDAGDVGERDFGVRFDIDLGVRPAHRHQPADALLHKVSIIPRGVGALGYTLQRPIEDRFLMRRDELRNRMAALLGGRAAEHLVFGEISTGAGDDLQRVTEIARAMVTRYGMIDALGQVALETERGTFLGQPIEGGGRRCSEATGREIDEAVRALIDEAYAVAKDVLTRRRGDLERLAALLLEGETLTAADLSSLAVAAA